MATIVTLQALITLLVIAAQTTFTGTLSERLVAEKGTMRLELKPAENTALPGVEKGDRIYTALDRRFKQPSAPEGMAVALVQSRSGSFLFADMNLDGQLTESERMPCKVGATQEKAGDVPVEARLGSGLLVPLTVRVVIDKPRSPKPVLLVPPVFHLEGTIDVAGQRTLVTLPFRFATTVDLTNGPIGIDTNGNGTIDAGLSRETLWAHDEQIVRRAGDKYVSFESVDLEQRTFTMRERTKDEYKLIEVAVGQPLQDFEFTDFDGKAGRLSDYRGKYLLIDFWGTWCKPCVAEVPDLKKAHARLSGKDFDILGLDFENDDTADKVRPFLEAKSVTWRNATPESVKDLVEKRFRTTTFPSFILVDPDGVVVEIRSSELRGKKLVPTVERLMKQR